MTYKPDFLITPGVIAYDEDIPYAGERLYSVIYWLHNLAKGECTASNEMLASWMGKGTTPDYVSRLLKLLEDHSYIRREYADSEKLTRERIIPLVSFRVDETVGGGRRNDTGGVDETIQQISNNISNNNKYCILPEKLGNTPLSRLKKFYSYLYETEFQAQPRVMLNGRDGGVLKSLLKEYTEWQIAALMVAHFNWYGPDGRDEREHTRMEKAGFPITWISPNVNKYAIFLAGTHTLNLNSEKSVKKFVDGYMNQISTGPRDKSPKLL